MPIDAMAVGVAFREISNASQNTKSYELHTSHYVQTRETLDPSLTNQHVYKNRADWFVSAAINGFVDVDVPVQTGGRRYIPMSLAIVLTSNAMGVKKKNGMKLY